MYTAMTKFAPGPKYKLNLGVAFDDDSACKFSKDALQQVYG
jgi:hypothetical protein